MSLKDELKRAVRGEVEDSSALLDRYSRDASLFTVRPRVVVKPVDASDVSAVVRLASEKRKANDPVSITVRAAGTDMSGGPLGDSIILDTTAHLNHFLQVGDGWAVAEPGMYFRDFDRETKRKGLELPSYTASREICTVGGMAANDSGGEKNLKYGKTARYVEELDAVLSDGEVHTFKNLSGAALTEKLSEQSFEGELYRGVAELLTKNRTVIEAAKPIVGKNSSGYALWDIGDGQNSLNLARLFVGSQGTLGIITRLRFRLVRPKPESAMAVVFLNDIAHLGPLVPEILKHEPDSFESYDDHTFTLALKYFPELAVQMKAGILSLGLSLLPEMWMAATGGVPKLVLLVEFRAEMAHEAREKAKTLVADIARLGLHDRMRIAPSERAAKKYWAIRRESFNLLRKKVRGMRTAPFIDDFVVPPATLPEFLPKLTSILSGYDLTYTVAGHVGDGNFHIIPLIDPKRPDAAKIIEELSGKVYDLVLSYKGSISGEHNDGLIRTPYVEKMFGHDMAMLFADVKRLFDPETLFNPGKKVGLTFAEAWQKLDFPAMNRRRGA